MPTLSLCMIVKNEADYLERCLNSVKDVADEIIIVDTGSTDNTIEIAKKFNVKIIEHKWSNDFSEARNISLKNATKDWILVLDADETISKKDLEKIKELIKNKSVMGYFLIQRTYMNDSSSPKWVSSKGDNYTESKDYGGWVYTYLIRLFQNKKEIFFENPVHETVEYSIKKMNGEIKEADMPIHHMGKVRSKEFVEDKGKLYLELGKKKAGLKGDAKSYSELGIQSQVLGNFDEAVSAFKKSIELEPKLISNYTNLGSIYIKQEEFSDAADILSKANEIDSENSDIHNNLGIAYEKLRRISDAIAEYEKAIKLNPENVECYTNLARICFNQKEFDKVIELLEKAIQLNPKDIIAYNNLSGAYLSLEKPEEAIKILNNALKISPNNIDLLSNLGVIYAQQKDYKSAIKAFNDALNLDPGNDEIKSNIEKINKLK